MAIGTYGTLRPSDVSPQDVEIIMNYTPSRDVTDQFILTTLDAQTVLRPYFNNNETGGNSGVEVLGGLYNLTLPSEQFNQLGFTDNLQSDKDIVVTHTGGAVTYLVLHKQAGYNAKVEYEQYGAYDDETVVGALDIVGSPDYTG